MYNFIKGEVVEVSENCVVIDCNGIGYELNATFGCMNLCSKGGIVKLYTYLAISQDDVRLFGFADKAEKSMFLRLIEVGGVGPKLAIGILSGISVSALSVAIVNADIKTLSKLKGLGKKTAERIVLELKDKVSPEFNAELPALKGEESADSIVGVNEDAVMAIMTFGYTKAEAIKAVKAVQKEGMTVEQIVFKALQIA